MERKTPIRWPEDAGEEIVIQRRVLFGKTLNFPVNALALDLARLLYRKTFSEDNLKNLDSMGYTIVWAAESETLTKEDSV